MNIEIKQYVPSMEEFKEMRTSVGWLALPPDEAIKISLRNTEFSVAAYVNGKLAGMGRIVGDKGFIYFIADIIVKPEFQGRGIGAGVMKKIMAYLEENAPGNAYITLMAAKGKEAFYEKFGWFKRPTEKYGHGMMVEME